MLKRKKIERKTKHFFYEICCIIKINASKEGFYFLMRAGYHERKINYKWPNKYWGIFKAYSGMFSTLCNPCIFIALSYSEPWHLQPEAYSKLWNFDRAYWEPCDSQNSLSKHQLIQPYSGPCVTLAYAGTWHIRYPEIFLTL